MDISKTVGAIVLCWVSFAVLAGAAGLGEVHGRMKERAEDLGKLKMAKTVGEDNQGFVRVLPSRDADAEALALVKAENADRQLVYEAIAKRTGVSAKVVGRNRAVQIAKQAEPGVMIQRPDGTWAEKQ